MKKIFITTFASMFIALPLYASAHESSIPHEEPVPIITEEEITPLKTFTTCSQDAIEKRDTNIALSRSDYNISMNTALLERKNNEKNAVSNERESSKKAALKISVENYKNKAKTTQGTLTQARKNAWQTFENDIKKCRDEQEDEPSLVKEISTQTISEDERKKMDDSSFKETKEIKTIKDTFKAQLENLRLFFK
jgi:hypothetical protein